MRKIQNAKNFILDTLFPINCLSCGRDDVWLCDSCQKAIEMLSFQKCPLCEKVITKSGYACPTCRPKSPLDALLVATKYKESSISKIIHLYKYRFIEDLHIPLGELLVKILLQSELPLPNAIIPIPLHPRRLRWRGFNQSGLMSDYVGKNLIPNMDIPVYEKLLQRKKYTPPQMKIKSHSQRMENLRDAFSIDDRAEEIFQNSLRGKTILLVDDIATTGATIFECAKALKACGAKKVFAIVIARQEMN